MEIPLKSRAGKFAEKKLLDLREFRRDTGGCLRSCHWESERTLTEGPASVSVEP